MSILNLFNGGSYIDQPVIKTGNHITTSTEYKKGSNTVKHYIDDTGHHIHHITADTKLMSFDHDGVLLPCSLRDSLYEAVDNVNAGNIPLSKVLTVNNSANNGNISNVNVLSTNDVILRNGSVSLADKLADIDASISSLGSGEGGLQNLSSVLTVGNSAPDKSMTVNIMSCNALNVDGIVLVNEFNELKTDATISSSAGVYGAEVNCETLGVGASAQIGGKFYFNADGDNTIAGNGTSLLTGFRTINNLLAEINTLKAYIDELKQFFVAFKDGIYLESAQGSGSEYNYTELMPAEI